VFVLLIFATFSCKKEPELAEKLQGIWLIDSLLVNGVDIQNQYAHNGITIHCVNDLHLLKVPALKTQPTSLKCQEGEYQLITQNGRSYVSMKTQDAVFSGKFQLFFSKIEKDSMEHLEMVADNIKIKCVKEPFGY
jgi:hypothetical protein